GDSSDGRGPRGRRDPLPAHGPRGARRGRPGAARRGRRGRRAGPPALRPRRLGPRPRPHGGRRGQGDGGADAARGDGRPALRARGGLLRLPLVGPDVPLGPRAARRPRRRRRARPRARLRDRPLPARADCSRGGGHGRRRGLRQVLAGPPLRGARGAVRLPGRRLAAALARRGVRPRVLPRRPALPAREGRGLPRAVARGRGPRRGRPRAQRPGGEPLAGRPARPRGLPRPARPGRAALRRRRARRGGAVREPGPAACPRGARGERGGGRRRGPHPARSRLLPPPAPRRAPAAQPAARPGRRGGVPLRALRDGVRPALGLPARASGRAGGGRDGAGRRAPRALPRARGPPGGLV
ncbi:MAG: hypothetical protein AVDCRST_MAG13-1429, partial [uncultured Solirubrobacteraceae bacterium]